MKPSTFLASGHTHDILCLKCSGSGIDHDKATTRPGVLMPLCGGCMGTGLFSLQVPPPMYRAIFLVGTRFIVRVTMPLLKGGFIEMDMDWSPHLPPEKGRGRLRPSEKRDLEAGRTEVMRQHAAIMGINEFSLVPAGARH